MVAVATTRPHISLESWDLYDEGFERVSSMHWVF